MPSGALGIRRWRRLTGQLSGEGNSAAFASRPGALSTLSPGPVALGQRPDYQLISRHVVNIDALFIDYARIVLPRHNARAWVGSATSGAR